MDTIRLMAIVYRETTHVIAAIRHNQLVGGRVAFRRFDNDSSARRRRRLGTLVNASALYTSCEMHAITAEGSALHLSWQAWQSQPRETVDLASPSPPRHQYMER